MKLLAALLAVVALAFPTHAASPRTCRISASHVNRVHVAATAHATHNQPQFVVTTFAVPVAVPVAPFASYWYSVSDYRDTSSLPRSTPQPTAPEALPRESLHSLITQRCASCHGRTSPKQGLSLVDPLSLSEHDRLRAIRAVLTGQMPPETEPALTESDRNAIVRDLLNETPK
jgi:mono/diheme cytochrome c family protein